MLFYILMVEFFVLNWTKNGYFRLNPLVTQMIIFELSQIDRLSEFDKQSVIYRMKSNKSESFPSRTVPTRTTQDLVEYVENLK